MQHVTYHTRPFLQPQPQTLQTLQAWRLTYTVNIETCCNQHCKYSHGWSGCGRSTQGPGRQDGVRSRRQDEEAGRVVMVHHIKETCSTRGLTMLRLGSLMDFGILPLRQPNNMLIPPCGFFL